ncbi:MAG: PDZ domain-containing protein [Elusimicrobiota bacterium]
MTLGLGSSRRRIAAVALAALMLAVADSAALAEAAKEAAPQPSSGDGARDGRKHPAVSPEKGPGKSRRSGKRRLRKKTMPRPGKKRPQEPAEAKAPGKKRPQEPAEAKAPGEKRAQEPEAPAKADSPDRDLHTVAGLCLAPSESGLRVLNVLPRTESYRLGLAAADTLLRLNGRRTGSVADVSRALRSWKPRTRLSAVVSRRTPPEPSFFGPDIGGDIVTLETSLRKPSRPSPRLPSSLTFAERRLKEKHLAEARKAAASPLASLPAPGFQVAKGQEFWIRFPEGVPRTVQPGDVLEGETSTSMASDASLDLIAIPQGSRVWVRVLSVKDDGPALLVRLHPYKIRLEGGHTYPCSAVATDLSGSRSLVQVSPGGTIVAAPLDEDPFLIGPDRNLQARFIEPLTIHEPDTFYLAGPGLWFHTVGSGKTRAFEVTHVIRDRDAHHAGIKKGDRIYYLGDAPAHRLEFSKAIRRLYGPPGTTIEVRVMRAGQSKAKRITLTRGVVYGKGLGLRVEHAKSGTEISHVDPASPADRAGLKAGYELLRIGDKELAGMSGKALRALLEDKDGEKALTYRAPGKPARTLTLSPDRFPVPIRVRSRLKDYGLSER